MSDQFLLFSMHMLKADNQFLSDKQCCWWMKQENHVKCYVFGYPDQFFLFAPFLWSNIEHMFIFDLTFPLYWVDQYHEVWLKHALLRAPRKAGLPVKHCMIQKWGQLAILFTVFNLHDQGLGYPVQGTRGREEGGGRRNLYLTHTLTTRWCSIRH